MIYKSIISTNYLNAIPIVIFLFGFIECTEFNTSQLYTYTLKEYPDIKYCFSSMDVLDGSQSSNYLILKHDLDKNCTHVHGNIVISNVRSDGKGTEPDLEFLSEIKEITGSLKIRNSNISVIPLRNLRVIRGRSRLYGHDLMDGNRYSLEVSWDSNLLPVQSVNTVFDFRSLRSIVDGNILISNVFCQSLANIDWNELLEDPNRQNVIGKCEIKKDSLRFPRFKECSVLCPVTNGKKYCWGPFSNQCQIFSKCKKRMCANRCFLTKNNDEECCNFQCLGGCTSSTANSCIACQGVLDGNTCQPECPPKTIVNREDGMPANNEFFKPLFVNLCLKKCPSGLLEQEGECQSQCTFRKYERKGDQCVPCKKFCEQICTMEDIYSKDEIKYSYISLDSDKIKKMGTCTTFKGNIQIDKESFIPRIPESNPIKNPADLWFLSSLRNISGSVYIDLKEATFQLNNFSFLNNLQVIEGHYGENPISLGILNTNISFLGMTRLKSIGLPGFKTKPVFIRNNTNLCYFDVDIFKRNLRLDDSSSVQIDKLPDKNTCEKLGKVCNAECNQSFGCSGPDTNHCGSCLNMKLGIYCEKSCTVRPGYLRNPEVTNKVCLKCHEECLETCFGVRPDQCIGKCKHAKEDNKCVSQCSRTHYLNNFTRTCERCHVDCHPRNLTRLPVCTGPSSKPGPGGCNKCQSIIIKISGNKIEAEQCFNKPFLSDYFSENHPNTAMSPFSEFTEKFTDLIVTFRPCHPLCSKCTDINSCTQCKGYWRNNECVSKCPLESTYIVKDKKNTSKGYCNPCSQQCNGCYGEGINKCIKCKKFILPDEKNLTRFSCVDKCPQNYKYDNYTSDLNPKTCVFALLSRLELIIVILTIIFIFCVLILITVISKIVHSRKIKQTKEKLNAHFSNANEKDSNNMNGILPNMSKLTVISSEYLEYSEEILGKGTFGTVHSGKWKPIKSDFDDSSSITSCKDQKVDIVIKVLNNSCDQDGFLEEARIMASVRHKHCLRLIGVSFKDNHKLLISSLMPLGSMDKYLINNKRSLSNEILLLWGEQIANGMLYLEKNRIIHRDLATRNVLIYKVDHVLITDFGLSKIMKPNKDQIQIFGGMVPVRWLAIETLKDGIYSHKTDVWAYAVTLWEIFTFAEIPYKSTKAHEIRDEIIKGTRLRQPEICSLDIYILMLKCWSTDPEERPTFEYLWNEFKMFSNNSSTYLSHPNVEPNYKNSSEQNYIEIVPSTDDQLSNFSSLYGRKSKPSKKDINIPENIRLILSERPTVNQFYESASQPSVLNGSFNKFPNNTNFQNYQIQSRSSSPFTKEYLEPRTTRFL